MIEDDLTLASNSKIDLARLPSCFRICFLTHTLYRVNHRLAFDKRADEPFIEAPNPYDDEQGWLKYHNNLMEPIWQVGPIPPTALVDIVDNRGGFENTTFETKANGLKKFGAKANDQPFKDGPYEG